MTSKSYAEFKKPSEVQIFENDLRRITLRIWLSEWSTDSEPIDVSRNIPDELFCDDGMALSVRPTNLWDHWCLPIRLSRLSSDKYELQVSDVMSLPDFMAKFVDALENHSVLETYLMSYDRASYLLASIPVSSRKDPALSRLAPQLKTYPYFEKLVSDCTVKGCDRLTAIRNAIPSEYESIESSDGFYRIIIMRSSK